MSDGTDRYQADLRREGAADAVLRIVAAKTLLRPMVQAEELCTLLDLRPADLRAALARLRAAHGAPPPGPRFETFTHKGYKGWTDVDELVYAAVDALGTAGPAQVQTWLTAHGQALPYPSIATSLTKQVNLGRLVRPAHGRYRRAA